jgi:hypothetical protein
VISSVRPDTSAHIGVGVRDGVEDGEAEGDEVAEAAGGNTIEVRVAEGSEEKDEISVEIVRPDLHPAIHRVRRKISLIRFTTEPIPPGLRKCCRLELPFLNKPAQSDMD